jgi:hypothetical protein
VRLNWPRENLGKVIMNKINSMGNQQPSFFNIKEEGSTTKWFSGELIILHKI